MNDSAKQRFDVVGMTCSACQAAVSREVSKLDGVSGADVNLLSNTMDVHYDPETVDPERIIKAVRDAGYDAALHGKGAQTKADPAGEAYDTGLDIFDRQAEEMKKRLQISIPDRKSVV